MQAMGSPGDASHSCKNKPLLSKGKGLSLVSSALHEVLSLYIPWAEQDPHTIARDELDTQAWAGRQSGVVRSFSYVAGRQSCPEIDASRITSTL